MILSQERVRVSWGEENMEEEEEGKKEGMKCIWVPV